MKLIVLLVVLIILVLLAVAAMRPKQFRIQHSIIVGAARARIFALLSDLHAWAGWSPWERLDPAMQRVHRGASSGVGAIYEWSGSRKVGRGRMEITAARSPERLVIQLDFIAPFEAHNTTEFLLNELGDKTEVVWLMYGPSPFISRLMGLFFNMDKMIGRDFETGLSNLKALAEQG